MRPKTSEISKGESEALLRHALSQMQITHQELTLRLLLFRRSGFDHGRIFHLAGVPADIPLEVPSRKP